MYINPKTGKPIVLVGGLPSSGNGTFKQDAAHPQIFDRTPTPDATLPTPSSVPPLVQPQPAAQPTTNTGGGGTGGSGGGSTTKPPATQPTTTTPAGGAPSAPAPAPAAAPTVSKPAPLPMPAPYTPADLSTAITPPALPTVQPTTSPHDPNIGDFANQWNPYGQPDLYGWLKRASSQATG